MATNVGHIKTTVATNQQIAERQKLFSEAQMRAYLSVAIGGATYQEAGKGIRFEAKPQIINNGLTPAHNVTHQVKATILPFPLPDNLSFEIAEQEAFSGGVIGPRQDRIISGIVDDYVLDWRVEPIKRGEGAVLFTWGTVTYDDIFGEKRRRTNFCQIYTWLADGRIMGYYHTQHNDSD